MSNPVISEKEIMAYFQGGQDKGRSYQQVTFRPSGNKGKCLIDSGNLVGSAMEYNFFQTLGIKLNPYQQQGLSAQGEPLNIMGITDEISFTFHGESDTTFREKFIIIKNLSHQKNLGEEFMQQHKALHDHQQGKIILKEKGTQKDTEILLHNNQWTPTENQPWYVYSQVRVRIPAKTSKYIPVSIPAVPGKVEVVIEPVEGSKNPALLAKSVSSCNNHRSTVVLFNPLDKDVQLEKWCRLGRACPLGLGEGDEDWAVVGDITPTPEGKGVRESQLPKQEIEKRRKWVRDQFRLEESEILKNDPKSLKQVEDLLIEYWDTISKNKTDYGKTDLMELTIDLVPGAWPYKGRNRPLNPKKKKI